MSLSDIVIRRETIPVSSAEDRTVSVTVRGLSATDVALIISKHRDAVEAFYARAASGSAETADFDSLAAGLIGEAPSLLGLVIAVAADEPDLAETAAQLGLGAQAELLEAIFRLTLEQEGGLGKFLTTVGRLLRAMTPSPGVSPSGSP